MLTSFRTAEYQYIPALALPRQEQLNLRLNDPPSFHKPKSVIVVGLPAVEAAQLPPLRPVDPGEIYCLQKPALILPVEGAPLVFSTTLGHDWTLHVYSKSGASLDVPIKPDAAQGGFVIDSHMEVGDHFLKASATPTEADLAKLGPEISGTIKGRWGFDAFEGPTLSLRTSRPADWAVASTDSTALIVGRDDTLHLKSDQAVCVKDVSVEDGQGKVLKTTHKLVKPDELQVEIALKDVAPGTLKMQVKQYGLTNSDDVTLHSYAEAGHLDSFSIDAGDHHGVLKGTRLDEVAQLEVEGVHFVPAGLNRAGNVDELAVSAPELPT